MKDKEVNKIKEEEGMDTYEKEVNTIKEDEGMDTNEKGTRRR